MGKLFGGLLMVLFFVIVLAIYANGAVDCGNRGGEYVKNWAGWPVCIGATK